MRGFLAKWAALAALAGLVGGPAFALSQNGSQGDITALNGSVSLSLLPSAYATIYQAPAANSGSVSAQVLSGDGGTFSGTLTFQGSQDEGTSWFTVTAFPAPIASVLGTGTTTTTGAGNWVLNTAGLTTVRVTATSFSSGDANVILEKFVPITGVTFGQEGQANTGVTGVAMETNLNGSADAGAAYINSSGYTGHVLEVTNSDGGTYQVRLEGSFDNLNWQKLADTGSVTTTPNFISAAGFYPYLRANTPSANANGLLNVTYSGVVNGVPHSLQAVTDSTQPASSGSQGLPVPWLASVDGVPYVHSFHPNHFSCNLLATTSTSLANFTSGCTAPGAGLSLYITDISASSTVVSSATADNQLELKMGTASNCGSNTAGVWYAQNLAFTSIEAHLQTPIKLTANYALCAMDAATGTKNFTVEGFIAP